MPDPSTKTLPFPTDRAVGTLRVWSADGELSTCPAQGEVTVASDAKVALLVTAPHEPSELPGFVPGDLSALADIEPDALVGLYTSDLQEGATRSIAHLRSLQTLVLAGKVTDADLAVLTGMPELSVLDVQSDLVEGPGLAHVGRCHALKQLHVDCSRLAPTALAELGGLDKLTLLVLQGEVQGDHLRALPDLPAVGLLVVTSLHGEEAAVLDVPDRLSSLTELRCGLDTAVERELRTRYPKLSVNGSWMTPEAVARLGTEVAPLETNPNPPADVHPVELTAATWDEAIAGDTPVLVDFWAEWCGPCRAVAPVVEALAPELAGRVTVAKLDVEHEKGITERYGILGIPALLVFRGGEQIAKIAKRNREGILEELGAALAG